MNRREFSDKRCCSTVSYVLGSSEPSQPWRVVVVSSGGAAALVSTFQEALHQLGYEVGKNLLLEVREAKGNYDILPEIMKEIVSLKPDVIVAEPRPAVCCG